MPECQYLDGHGVGDNPIIQIVMNTGKMNTTDTSQSDVTSLRPNRWLRCKELKCPFQFYRKCIRSLRPMGNPPFGSFNDSSCRATDDTDRERTTHDRRICCRTCEAFIVSLRSASAMVASSLASSSGESSKVSSPSGANTVTVAPSGRLFTSILIVPPRTFPVVMSMTDSSTSSIGRPTIL